MKVADLINLLHHIPGETEVEDVLIAMENGAIKASHALENLISGKPLNTPVETPVETPKTGE